MPLADEPRGRQASGGAADAAAPLSRWLVLAVATFVMAFGAAGYAWLGNWEGLRVTPGTRAVADAARAPQALRAAQLEALAQRLSDRLKTQPDDAESWWMLGRSYSALGRYTPALQAYRHVIDLRPDNAQAHADYADALSMANGRSLDGEPEKLIAKALQLDPDNAKALALAGSLAFAHGDSALAVRRWERALLNVEPGSPKAQQLQNALHEARRLGGSALETALPGTLAGSAPAAQTTGIDATRTPATSVQVRITLAPSLRAQAASDDTVFIFARAVQGPKVPLAIQRRQVKDLPLEFTLDDTMAMDPALRLSSVSQVVVGARISKSGNALPQPGDIQGLSRPVPVGARGVRVEISQILQ